ncbi:MAG: DUF4136 domain-containing protein [Burkholderiales bacterium]|nr:DUF4136 domain-containing protein [Burkholderiales bacterium]
MRPTITTSLRWPLVVWALLLLVLSGCASINSVTSQVSSYGSWPEGRQPGRFVFERLPSQATQPALQNQLEAAALPQLEAVGFKHVADAAQADVSIQVGAQVHIDPRRRTYDPFWGPWGPGWGGWWGTGGSGISLSMTMEPAYVEMQVDVLIRDRHTNQVLYETHAQHDRLGTADDRLYAYLFEAALKDFPRQAISPRSVTVTIPSDHR